MVEVNYTPLPAAKGKGVFLMIELNVKNVWVILFVSVGV